MVEWLKPSAMPTFLHRYSAMSVCVFAGSKLRENLGFKNHHGQQT